MTHSDEVSPRFTEKQVSAILKRAAELQTARGDAADPAAGFSLAQLQQVAAELGIDPTLVAAAAAELEKGQRPGGRVSFWGGPWVTEIERTVEGPVSEEEWPELLEEIRRATGLVGKTTRVGRSFEWLGGTDDMVHVTITPQGERTRIRVFSRYGSLGAGLHTVSATVTFLSSLILIGIFHPGAIADLGLIAGVSTGAFAAARSGCNAICRRKASRAQQVMRALEKRIARPAPARSQLRPAASQAAPIEEQQVLRRQGKAREE